MTKTILFAFAFVLTFGSASAQMPDGMTDRARVAHAASGPAGTTGAMESVVQGIATSPQDVVAQQEGRSTAAEGNLPLAHSGTTSIGAAPGTVGAAPGNDAVR